MAGHSFRTGKPSCHPSRTHAPAAVAWQPTPHPPNARAGPGNAGKAKQNAKQAKRRVIAAPRMSENCRGLMSKCRGRSCWNLRLFARPPAELLSKESSAQIQPVAREKQRHHQTNTAKNEKRLQRFDINIDSRYAGESSCDSSHFPPPVSASGRGSVDAVVAKVVRCECALGHSCRCPRGSASWSRLPGFPCGPLCHRPKLMPLLQKQKGEWTWRLVL